MITFPHDWHSFKTSPSLVRTVGIYFTLQSTDSIQNGNCIFKMPYWRVAWSVFILFYMYSNFYRIVSKCILNSKYSSDLNFFPQRAVKTALPSMTITSLYSSKLCPNQEIKFSQKVKNGKTFTILGDRNYTNKYETTFLLVLIQQTLHLTKQLIIPRNTDDTVQ